MRPKSKANRDLPPRMLRRVRKLKKGGEWVGYYYNGQDGEVPLGTDLNEAKRRWAELECTDKPPETGLMRYIFDKYEREVIPTKATNTQRDNRGSLAMLRKVFDNVHIDSITPQHIARYRDGRKSQVKGEEGKPATVRANREISLLSHIFNMAREWGYTAKQNPVTGVRKNKETPRDFYADDEVWKAVYDEGCDELKDAMDVDYLTGQRPGDVLKMKLTDIRGEALEVTQNKTKKKLRILLTDGGVRTKLGSVIDRIKGRSRKVASLSLIATPAGTPLNKWTLRNRYDDARAAAAKKADEAGNTDLAARIRAFQFRDIRPKAASETDLAHASKLLGHTDKQITETVYRRIGETVKPTR